VGLRKSKGNMFGWVDFTWNPVKGECPHKCSYCYMNTWGKQSPIHLDESEFIPLVNSEGKEGNTIFVCSGTDILADGNPVNWMVKTCVHCRGYDNTYLFHTKNPAAFRSFHEILPKKSICAITLETNRHYVEIIQNAPAPRQRVDDFFDARVKKKMITVEPILDFDLYIFIEMIATIRPFQVNIGADSGRNNLPEPEWQKIHELIEALKQNGIEVAEKANLNRLRR
jgi:DNA repair photolyase